MSATVAPVCEHATGALAPKSSSQPPGTGTRSRCPAISTDRQPCRFRPARIAYPAIVESVCAIGGFFRILRETPRVDDRGISMRRAFAWVLCGVVLSACSAIPRPGGSNRGTVSLESNPPGAEARLSSSGASCRTPCTLPVKVSDYNVTFALAGYTPRFIPIRVSIKREHWYSPEVTYVDPNPVLALLQPIPPPPGPKQR